MVDLTPELWDQCAAEMKASKIERDKAECPRCKFGVCPVVEHWDAK